MTLTEKFAELSPDVAVATVNDCDDPGVGAGSEVVFAPNHGIYVAGECA